MAIRLFDDCINLLETEFYVSSNGSKTDLHKTFCQSKAETLEKANRLGDALNEYTKINERFPNDDLILEKISALKKSWSVLEKTEKIEFGLNIVFPRSVTYRLFV